MFQSATILSRLSCLGAVAMVVLAGLATPQAQAFQLPPPSVGSGCRCGNLEFDNSNLTGNLSIAGSGSEFIGLGPGTITGSVLFSAAQDTQFMPGTPPNNINVIGGPMFGVGAVQTGIDALNGLSQTLSTEPATTIMGGISAGGSIDASSGKPDGNGNQVFTATISSNFIPGATFTINGTSSQFVVVNIPASGDVSFDGSIDLTGGITSDQVLFNFDGAPDLTIENNPPLLTAASIAAQAIANTTTGTSGTFLNPNGSITVSDSVINGRVFGGATMIPDPDFPGVDFLISFSTINAPAEAPEPASLTLLGAGLAVFGVIRRRYRSISRR